MSNKAIYWFTNDLRLSDNPGLVQAVTNYDEVIPIYVIDEALFKNNSNGPEPLGPFRAKFLLESLNDLKTQLQNEGSDLIVKYGNPMQILVDSFIEYDCRRLFGSYSYSVLEDAKMYKLEESLPCTFYHSNLLHHPDDIPFDIDKTPDSFTEFKDQMDKHVSILESVEKVIPYFNAEHIDLAFEVEQLEKLSKETQGEKKAIYSFEGGETHALKRLNEYTNENKSVLRYNSSRKQLNSIDFSSKFSAYLALGCLSPKTILEKLYEFEKKVQRNISTYSLGIELIRRDFYKYMSMKHGAKIYLAQGIKDEPLNFKKDAKAFEEWKNGETKNEFVNANIKELNNTGYISVKGRQAVASYLVNQLKLDWRLGAKYFETMLIDFTPENNYANWMNIAQVGFENMEDIDVNDIAEKYDKNEEYRKYWLS